MVNLFPSFKTKRGRPSHTREKLDRGTPELQKKRRAILLSFPNQIPSPKTRNIQQKIQGGCLLHRLFAQGILTEKHLKIGISLRKIYNKACLLYTSDAADE